ncbi:PREDICTED: uncharacterized protein LOC100636695 [Amphimedon queenslandica]|uniref:Uncharacterized protein n=1 Tax=Amphimedon queenslandica TaxID=400682 RepID=A0A1X7VC54_AMPQE|nr:PREDICTED: uncharacterized protein LOC100636695 [Amphimedon queenslandica]|eukprot:XP_019849692.1 PREDICTED: uncharacterized protein LOC100636695 [Amphimedon queenslandica]
MADFVKKKIVEKLAKFTRDIKPSDISLSFLRGKGELRNLDLNTDVISSALQLPPWISIDHVFCDMIKLDIPFTDLNKSPIKCMLGMVTIEVSTSREVTKREKSDLFGNIGQSNSPSSYGLTEKIIDGMRIEINTILVQFSNPVFNAKLEISDVLIQSTNSSWTPDILSHCRYKNEEEGSVIIYKKATWSSIKIEGQGVEDGSNSPSSSTPPSPSPSSPSSFLSQLRLVTSLTEIRVALKRRLSDCKVLHTRVSVNLGDLVWVVTQQQLKAVSRLVQSLTDAAVNFAQHEREGELSRLGSSRDSLESLESVTSYGSSQDGPGDGKDDKRKGKRKKSPRRTEKDAQKERGLVNRLLEYQIGVKNLPSHEVVQDSFHLKTGNVDLQLCDEKASLLLQVKKLLVDVYLDQLAKSGRKHWNKSNIKLQDNVDWSSNLVTQASKRQDINMSSVNIYRLRERGVVIRCSDFSIKSIADASSEELLPIISCDKETFNLPNDIENPAFQCGITTYYYPIAEGNRFLVPRPNIFIYISPIHVNFHQEQCLWLAEFVQGVAQTVNLDLLLSAHDEGQHLLQELKAKRDVVNKLNGVDMKFYLPYSKITLPVNEVSTDGRPRALQIETGGITVENHTLLFLIKDETFLKAWERVKSGWFPNSQNQFPHSSNDPSLLPSNLVELIEAEIMGGVNTSPPNKNASNISLLHASGGRDQTHLSAPNITLSSAHSIASTNQINLLMLECWHAHTRCVNLSFVADMSHKATLHTKQFVQDFPFSLWLFQPKKFEEILLAATPNDTPTSSHLPSIYAMVDIASPISLQLEHLQFLFLMRLKDSFQYFKNRIMKYFSIDTLIESQGTQAFQVTKDGSDIESIDDGESSESTDDIKGKLKAAFARGRERVDSKVQGDYVTAGVSLSGLEVSIMLPTLTRINKKRKKGAKHETGPTAQVMNIETVGPDPSPAASSPIFPLEVSFSPPTPFPPDSVPSPLPPSLSQTEVIQNGTGPPKDSDSFIFVEPPQDLTQTELPPLVSSSSNVSSDANENTVPNSESTSSNEVPLPHSEATPPDDDVDIPNAPIDTLKPHLLNVANSLKSVSMSSTGGSSLSSFVVPEYILVAKVGVVQGGATISSEGICFKAAVRTVDLNEYKEEEYKLMNDEKSRRKRIKKEGGERDSDVLPVIKARLELGQSASTYFPKEDGDIKDPESDKEMWSTPEGVVFLKVNGLKPTLALKNTMVMKDFFDDEIESEVPIPLQLRLTETQVSLKDSVPAPLLHPRNLTVNIPDLFVNRGPRARNTNLLTAEGGGRATPVVGMATPLVIKKSGIATPTVGVATPIVARRQEEGVDDEKLLQSLVDHLKANEGKTQSNHKLQALVKEIQGLLETTPTYTDSLSCDFYTNLTSDKPHPTVERLQNEIDTLRKENTELNGSLSRSREDTKNVAEERAEVVKQLVKVQMEHATLQLAHEKQLRQIDRLVTEKGDLQEQLKQYGIT